MTETIRFSLIGLEDLHRGTAPIEVTLADGRVVLISPVEASGIPTDSATEDIQDYLDEIIRARRGFSKLLQDLDQDDTTTTGLTWGYKAGRLPNGSQIAASTVTLTANATNYVELDPEAGTVSVNTSGFNSASRVPIRQLVTNASAITTNTDSRPLWQRMTTNTILQNQVFS